MRGVEHDRLWNQLEAEIHLHRHKTVIRACRGRGTTKGLATPPQQNVNKERRNLRPLRQVTLPKAPHEGLGISITVRWLSFLLKNYLGWSRACFTYHHFGNTTWATG